MQFRLGLAAQWHILDLLYIPIKAKFTNLPNFLEVLKFWERESINLRKFYIRLILMKTFQGMEFPLLRLSLYLSFLPNLVRKQMKTPKN